MAMTFKKIVAAWKKSSKARMGDQCDSQAYLNLTTRAGSESIVISRVR
jgi:hypothetical protein